MFGAVGIKMLLEQGLIKCYPEPTEDQLQLASIDVTLGQYVAFPSGSYTVYTEFADAREAYDIVDLGTDGVLELPARGFVLSHTEEFIGSASPFVNTELKTRSTMARWGLDICRGAGFGDPGFCGRWTLEIQNATDSSMYIPVGSKVGQIVFHEVIAPDETRIYDRDYNQGRDTWKPEHMLPKNLKRLER